VHEPQSRLLLLSWHCRNFFLHAIKKSKYSNKSIKTTFLILLSLVGKNNRDTIGAKSSIKYVGRCSNAINISNSLAPIYLYCFAGTELQWDKNLKCLFLNSLTSLRTVDSPPVHYCSSTRRSYILLAVWHCFYSQSFSSSTKQLSTKVFNCSSSTVDSLEYSLRF